MIKLEKSLDDFKYLLTFDLASKNTGVCLFNLKQNKPEKVFMVQTKKKDKNFVLELYNLLDELFDELFKLGIKKEEIFVAKEAMPTQLRGGSSTVQTFIALAKSHAVLDLYLDKNNINVYDYVGIYPASTHAYLKKVLNLDSKASVDKTDIQKYIYDTYGFQTETLDESDAVFLAITLINSKWNKDIEEEIKEVKRHKKTLKLEKAIRDCDERINFLENLKKRFEN
jgi:hypothetical protein